jgi:hypothetical protein
MRESYDANHLRQQRFHTARVKPSKPQNEHMFSGRFEKAVDFDAKRQFLLDHVEKVIYDRYHVVVIGSVPVKPVGRDTDSDPEQVRKLEYRVEGRIDTSKLHRKPRKKYAEDGRLKAFGSSGRRRVPVAPCCSEHKTLVRQVSSPLNRQATTESTPKYYCP